MDPAVIEKFTDAPPQSGRRLHWRAGASEKWQLATSEASRLFKLAPRWRERLRIARFLAQLYVARALPLDTYRWGTSIRLRGARYTFGLRTSEIYVLEEVFDYRLYDQLADYVPEPGWVVFDVGANVGVVSMCQAERGARVYAFEPNPDCFGRLLRNIVDNGLSGLVQAFNVALGDHVAEGEMCVQKGGTTGGTVIEATSSETACCAPIKITTLDHMASALGVPHVDLLKVDVEGAEVDVLRGAARALRRTRRMIVEYHCLELLEQVCTLAEQNGFELERRLVYYPECPSSGQAEVGLLYFRRRDLAAA